MVAPDGIIIESEREKAIYKMGIKEVVEWILSKRSSEYLPFLHISMMYDDFQAKLEEWGIK